MNWKRIVLYSLLFSLSACQGLQSKPDLIDKTPEPTITMTPTTAPADDSIVVTTNANIGPGTLREALQDARFGDTITFDPTVFPPDDPATIFVIDEELPHLNVDQLILDASNAGVILDGRHLEGDWIAGLQIVNSSGNQIMGLQVTNFTGPGIGISGNSSENIIGGDRSIGEGPWGQGNLLSNNNQGINISVGTNNTVTGNLIGVDLAGTDWLGNENFGIHIGEGARENTIGPNNIIAYNGRDGVYIDPPYNEDNIVTQNTIYDNGIGIGWPAPPVIVMFDLDQGTLTGATCPNCIVEIYSTSTESEQMTLEGQTEADEIGVFSFNKGEPFAGPSLTAKTTTLRGRKSLYHTFPPTSGTKGEIVLQTGNQLPFRQFFFQLPSDIPDNHLGAQYDGIGWREDRSDQTYVYSPGKTRARVSNSGLEPELVDWEKPEFEFSQAQDEHYTRLSENGVIITYVLIFWDKENYPEGKGLPCARFKTEEEIERWLEYVRFTVDHLQDRVTYFELWNEPDIENYCPKWIELDDYINLIRRTAPVIREAAPEAKIVVGAVSKTYYPSAQNYLLGLLRSEAMPLVDVISWHPFYGESPKYDSERAYYYNYPDFVKQIKETAAANGFVGEYHADEVGWSLEPSGGQYGEYGYLEATKYFLRSVLQHRGMGIDLGGGSNAAAFMIRRLSTLMAGVEPAEFPVEIDTSADNILNYTFSTLEGDRLIAVWTNGIAVEDDPGIEATLTVPDLSPSQVVGIDLLSNLEQELAFEREDGNLVIRNLLVKDYPLIIKLVDLDP